MKNKGFTLVELLAVIIILALIMILVVPNAMNAGNNVKDASFITKKENIESAAQLYGSDLSTISNIEGCITLDGDEENIKVKYISNGTVSDTCYEFRMITVQELAEEKYIKYDNKKEKKVTNPKDSSADLNNDLVFIYKKHKRVYAVYQENNDELDSSIAAIK